MQESTKKKVDRGAFLTYKQLSELLEVPIGTLYYLVSTEQVPFLRLGKGRIVRFEETKVDEWLNQNRSGWNTHTERKLGDQL